MRCTECTPIDDDAENTGIRPLEACVSLSIEGRKVKEKNNDIVEMMYLHYPFETVCEPYMKWLCVRYRIRQHAYLYQECFDAVMLAYMYSICRCSLLPDRDNAEHVKAYVKKLMKIYVIAAITISNDSQNLCIEHGFRQVNCDDYRV